MATYEDKNWRSWLLGFFSLAGVFAPAIFCSGNHAFAQIIPDNTLGDRPSTITPNINIKGSAADRIDGGVIRGANLFHSFQDFNVRELQRVYFANPTGIENILTRVTGSHISKILGTLGVDGGANLFFLNPNGILFGNNARLDVAGSFVASTANSFVFGDKLEFSATEPQAPPLLKITLTPGLQYGQNDPSRTIQNTGNLAAGQDLKLFAGNLDLQGQLQAGRNLSLQGDTVKVRDSVTHPFIAAAGGKLFIQGYESIDIFALNHPNSGLFSGGDMVLQSANTVGGDAHFWSGGSFRIEKLNGSLGNLFSPYDPVIRASGDVSFDNYTGASLHILAGGSVKLGTAIITGTDTTGDTINPTSTPTLANVNLSDGTPVVIDGSQRPTLDVRAGVKAEAIANPLGISGNNFTLLFPPSANNPVATSADITIGSVQINPPSGLILLTNHYKPNLSLAGGDITLTGQGTSNIGGMGAGSVEGDGGSVIFDSRGNITLANSYIDTYSGSTRAGDITLLATGNIKLDPGSRIFANALIRFPGDASDALGGDVRLIGGGDVSINKAEIFVASSGGGSINIDAQNIEISDSSIVSGIRRNLGSVDSQAGDLRLNARERISIDASNIYNSVAPGGIGNAGKILVQANGLVSLSGESTIYNSIFPEAAGSVGGITLRTGSLFLIEGAELVAVTEGQGNAGTMELEVRDLASFDGIGDDGFASGLFATVFPSGVGRGGDITLKTGSLSITDGARIQTKSEGQGDTGNVTVEARDRIFFDGTEKNPNPAVDHLTGIFTTVETATFQQGGNIKIKTGSLSLNNGGQLTANTFGRGNSGSVMIEARDHVFFDGANSPRNKNTGVFSAVGRDSLGAVGEGQGGDIQIVAESLSLKNGAAVAAATLGRGNAGKVTIVAQEKVSLDGIASNGFRSEIVTSVEPEAIGNANDIDITTGLLTVTNGAQLRASTVGQGEAGNIKVRANILEATDGGQLSTSTSSNFDAGDITLKVRDNFTLSGSDTGIFANTTLSSTGNGGNISIDPRTLTIRDGAKIAVDSQGTGIGGNIELAAGALTLDKGIISAETRSNTGGNITLNLQELLLLRNGSQISTTAGNNEFGGDGGNITINTPFIVAVPRENSDITANAFTGKGGRVDITANGIFGIVPQKNPTEKSDITASSELGVSGEITINTPDTDPSRGLIQLPSNLVDASQQIASGCTPRGRQTASRFIATGRGGLPLSPNEPLRGRAVITDWVDLPPQVTEGVTDKLSTASMTKSTHQIVEAQGWIVDAKGDVMLVAQSDTKLHSRTSPRPPGTPLLSKERGGGEVTPMNATQSEQSSSVPSAMSCQ
ncbi:hypothetical protein BZZ01_15135 [Nostocales cyanobacterium HT-58-2]|nr:hypothetical protein BZZ01_15135 [Nostocales cyanobacterium HT-58-2]